MDDKKRIRIALIIVNLAIVIPPILIWYLFKIRFYYSEWYVYSLEKNLTYWGWIAELFTFANIIVFLYIFTENYATRFRIEEQRKNEKFRKKNVERELQMKRERQLQYERKLKLMKNYETAGRYEDAAKICDELEMWEEAGTLRKMSKTSYLISTNFSMGKNGAISCTCPNCGSSQAIASKSNTVKCAHCGSNYIIPKKVLDMM